MVENQLWYDKHRPKSLEDYVWPDDKLKSQVIGWIEKKSIPSIMFAGGPGRGKSTLAELIIAALAIDDSDLLRLKGAKDNSAETIRTKVQEFCELGGWSGLRIVYFDEADLLSRTAQEMLRNIIDDYSDSVRFVFTCNYPHKIIDAVATSRLIRINIDKLPSDDFIERLVTILMAEKVGLTEQAIQAVQDICDTCYPDLRRAINILESSVNDGILKSVRALNTTVGVWENYFTELLTVPHDRLREICKIRETLAAMSPDEMEDVYKFLYHNGTKLFGEKEISAIIAINDGQKSHRYALLPDMILLQVILKLMVIVHE